MRTTSSSAVSPLVNAALAHSVKGEHAQRGLKKGGECAAMTERKRSIIWSYFTPVNNDEASCDVCQKTVRHCGNTTNMIKHLKVKHPKEHDEVHLRRAEEVTETRPPSSSGLRQSSLAESFQRGGHYPGIKW